MTRDPGDSLGESNGAEGLACDSPVPIVAGNAGQADQAQMREIVYRRLVWFARRTIPSIWDSGNCNTQFKKLNVILDETKSLLFDSALV